VPARRTIAWGILGTGKIARQLAEAIRQSPSGHLAAVGSRTLPAARAFAQTWEIPRAFGSYQEVLDCKEVEAIYISLPNHLHAEWTIRAAKAGKHILCEKPFTVNRAEAERAIEAVRNARVFLMEAFMYRLHPQTARLAEIVQRGDIGEVRHIQASFSYNMGLAQPNIRLNNAEAGGGIMDVGCYPLSLARLIAGASRGNPFLNPSEVRGSATLGEQTRVDHQAVASLKFPGGCLAEISCGTQVATDCAVRIWGSDGHILVPIPWKPPERHARLLVRRRNETSPTEELIDAPAPLYTLQVEAVAAAIRHHDFEIKPPGPTWADTLGNMAALDAWRASVGLTFDCERR